MYILAIVALLALWRAHRRAPEARGRLLAGALLIGFGAWHVMDAVLVHWVLGRGWSRSSRAGFWPGAGGEPRHSHGLATRSQQSTVLSISHWLIEPA
jgi:hypothetical protein